MGEIVLSRVGDIAGTALLPNGVGLFGQTVSGAAIGRTLGRFAGRAIDASLQPAVESPRLKSLHLLESRDGAPLPFVAGRMRVGGHLIWASRFKEARREQAAGKGGPKYIEYAYSISLAIALGQGPITRLDRVWANGEPFSLRDVTWRLYQGTSNQLPDPLIEAIEGANQTPAYRDTAYIVFEDLPLDAFGNRIPQFSFEIVRASDRGTDALATKIHGVNIIPASGEFVYATSVVRERRFPGIERTINLNNARGEADFTVSLDQLISDLPRVQQVALTVSWFGDDLRAGECRLRPGVERRDRATVPYAWSVDQADRASAHLISQTNDSPNFGGTPADEAVLEGIAALKAVGIEVTLSPFLLMDIPPGNALPHPRGWTGQPTFPWRGRITVTADKTATARAEIDRFVGEDGAYGFRHFILHHARLAVRAGGVETILIGSEMIGLTRVRDEQGRFPFVEALQSLANEVKAIVGDETKVSYAADWTEYGAYAPGDGSRDVLFPLDPLWASDSIDFVGVDWYPPTGDWRDGDQHLDALAGYTSADSKAYLRAQMNGGEAFDWYYGSDEDRDAQIRRPISDGARGEDWIFRAKDLVGWWTADHHARPRGTWSETPTAWRSGLKPIRIIELGFPAIDKGANAPNVFVDPKSSENAVPFYSNGTRDDLIQRRALSCALSYWQEQDCVDQVLVWAWDARPWPDFPAREEVWSDGSNWQFGHWLNGRTGLMELSDLVQDIAGAAGIEISSSDLDAVVDGYFFDGPATAESSLQPLALAYNFIVREDEEGLSAVPLSDTVGLVVNADSILQDRRKRTFDTLSTKPTGVTLSYISGDFSYLPATSLFRLSNPDRDQMSRLALPLVLSDGAASKMAQSLFEEVLATDTFKLGIVGAQAWRLQVGDCVTFEDQDWRLEQITDSLLTREMQMRVVTYRAELSRFVAIPNPDPAAVYPAEFEIRIIDLPGLGSSQGPSLAVTAEPWTTPVAVQIGTALSSLKRVATVSQPAGIGRLLTDMPQGTKGGWDEQTQIEVQFLDEVLSSADESAVREGENCLLIETGSGWQAIGWKTADMISSDRWILSGLWRGPFESEADAISAGATLVICDQRLVEVPIEDEKRGFELLLKVGPSDPISFIYVSDG